ncbi:MAG: hydrogenase expression/formation protein HypE [Dehalococcoidia bacterium]|nr:hydrogenase expression/formation protein HypE [Dehalococcoidia bacterium]
MEERILMAHGSGGKLSHELITQCFASKLNNQWLSRMDDAAVIDCAGGQLAFTTDSYVVTPLFFPGGDIGKLAVCGTVNDLAVSGAVPQYLSLSFILEEGLLFADLERVIDSIQRTAAEANVAIVTGDTKVVPHGKADGIFINTSGIGRVMPDIRVSGSNVRAGDAIIISGNIGDHGMAIMAQREGLRFDGDLASDCAPLNALIADMLDVCPQMHCMRDPTRGGVATTLNEIAAQSGVGMLIGDDAVPVRPSVRALCEMLGLDPLYVANEGKLLAFAPADAAESLLGVMHANKYGRDAAVIGTVTADNPGQVVLRTKLGTSRILAMLAGDIMPRIC